MSHTVSVGDSSLVALYLRVDAGSEKKAVETLTDKGYTQLYKVFGQYDILALFEVDDLQDERIYYSCEGVQVSRPLTAFPLKTQTYTPHDIDSLKGSPIIGFIFLEIDKWFYTNESKISISSLLSEIILLVVRYCEAQNIDISFLGGYGKSELYVIVKSTCISDIWKVTSFCRSLTSYELLDICSGKRYPIFVKTKTIPSVSYDFIHYEKDMIKVSDVEGECFANITLECSSGFEKYIPDYFNEDEYEYREILGNDDGMISTIKAVKTKDLIETVLNFRDKWSNDHKALVSTRTIIQETSTDICIVDKDIDTHPFAVIPREIPIPTTLKTSRPILANKITNFVNNINSYMRNRSYHFIVNSVDKFIEYIEFETEKYGSLNSDKELFNQEAILIEAIENAERGLAQRIDSNFDAAYHGNELPLQLGDGIFSSLIAIEVLINYIFKTWSECTPAYAGRASSNGFPIYNDISGFRMEYGEAFSLPLASLYNPCDKQGNWLTLTHEITHSLYIRLNVESKYEKKFREFSKQSNNTYDVYIEGINELFTHWYDYYHFYGRKIEVFLQNIWSSWILLPVVQKNPEEYLFRSYLLFIYHHIEELRDILYGPEILSEERQPKAAALIDKIQKEHIQTLQHLFPDFPEIFISILEDKEKAFLTLFSKAYFEAIDIFEEYKNDIFKEKINEAYEDLNDQISDIKSQKIVTTEIVNPYILIKELLAVNAKNDKLSLSASVALIMSLKNSSAYLDDD